MVFRGGYGCSEVIFEYLRGCYRVFRSGYEVFSGVIGCVEVVIECCTVFTAG